MFSYLDISGSTLLNFPFPEEKITQILTKLSYPPDMNFTKATFEQRRIIFLISFREFLKGNLYLEEFSEIANSLTFRFDSETRTPEQDDYELAIYEAANASLEARQLSDPKRSMYAATLDTIWKYFNKYKYLLKDLSLKFPAAEFLENPKTYKVGEIPHFSFIDTLAKQKEQAALDEPPERHTT
jgi:uncharacterized protein YeeX (DUF496 family)